MRRKSRDFAECCEIASPRCHTSGQNTNCAPPDAFFSLWPPSIPLLQKGFSVTTCAALIVAAGRGQRFGGSLPKQYAPLRGELLLRRTLRAFCGHPRIQQVVVAIHPDDGACFAEAAHGLPGVTPVAGGAARQ